MIQDGRNGEGASVPDRATAVEPVPVSPLRDGIANAVAIITRRGALKGLPARFAEQYAHYKTAPWKRGEPIADIVARLNALDMETCDYEAIVEIMGTDWTKNTCDLCGYDYCDAVVRIGEEPDYDARWQDICPPCLVDLGEWAAQHESAVHAPKHNQEPTNG